MIPIKISREKSRALNCLDPQNTESYPADFLNLSNYDKLMDHTKQPYSFGFLKQGISWVSDYLNNIGRFNEKKLGETINDVIRGVNYIFMIIFLIIMKIG